MLTFSFLLLLLLGCWNTLLRIVVLFVGGSFVILTVILRNGSMPEERHVCIFIGNISMTGVLFMKMCN